MASRGGQLAEVLFEFRRIGNVVRVAAIDPVTGTEVTLVAAPGYSEHLIRRIAARKLAYVLAKKRKSGEEGA